MRTSKDASSGSSSLAFFDTFLVDVKQAGGSKAIQAAAAKNGVNVRIVDDNTVGISFGEAITKDDCISLLKVPTTFIDIFFTSHFLLDFIGSF